MLSNRHWGSAMIVVAVALVAATGCGCHQEKCVPKPSIVVDTLPDTGVQVTWSPPPDSSVREIKVVRRTVQGSEETVLVTIRDRTRDQYEDHSCSLGTGYEYQVQYVSGDTKSSSEWRYVRAPGSSGTTVDSEVPIEPPQPADTVSQKPSPQPVVPPDDDAIVHDIAPSVEQQLRQQLGVDAILAVSDLANGETSLTFRTDGDRGGLPSSQEILLPDNRTAIVFRLRISELGNTPEVRFAYLLAPEWPKRNNFYKHQWGHWFGVGMAQLSCDSIIPGRPKKVKLNRTWVTGCNAVNLNRLPFVDVDQEYLVAIVFDLDSGYYQVYVAGDDLNFGTRSIPKAKQVRLLDYNAKVPSFVVSDGNGVWESAQCVPRCSGGTRGKSLRLSNGEFVEDYFVTYTRKGKTYMKAIVGGSRTTGSTRWQGWLLELQMQDY